MKRPLSFTSFVLFRAGLVLTFFFLWDSSLYAQPSQVLSQLNVFLECNSCDMNFIKQEISQINYLRDREDAHVHIMFHPRVHAMMLGSCLLSICSWGSLPIGYIHKPRKIFLSFC